MIEDKIIELLIKIIQAFSVNVVLFIIFVVLLVFIIKIKKANWLRVIDFYQNFIAYSVSLYIFALLPIYISCFVWVLTFFILRNVVFRKNEVRKYQIYSKHSKYSSPPVPKIANLSQIKEAFFPVHDTKVRYKDSKYSFLSYSNTGVCLILFLLLEIVETSKTINLLYFVEFMVIASIIFIFIGRFTYYVSFYNPNSVGFGSDVRTHILVILFGILYYFVIISILIYIHGIKLFSW